MHSWTLKGSIGITVVCLFSAMLSFAHAATPVDYYEVLGVSKTDSDETIKIAGRRLLMQYHPDRNEGDRSVEPKFREVVEALEVLSSPEKRALYDSGQSLNLTPEQRYQQEVQNLKKLDADIRLFGAMPDPNAGNPGKTLEDLARYVWPRFPDEDVFRYGGQLKKITNEKDDLRKTTEILYKSLEEQIKLQMESLPNYFNIFEISNKWIQQLPDRIEFHTKDSLEEYRVKMMHAHFQASLLWLLKLRPYSELLFWTYVEATQNFMNRKIKSAEESANSGFMGALRQRSLKEKAEWEVYKRDLDTSVYHIKSSSAPPVPPERQLPYVIMCKDVL